MLRTLIFSALLAVPFGWAEEEAPDVDVEVVVTAHRGETNADEVGSAYTILTAEEIDRSGATDLADLLRQVPGLDVVRSGPGGQTTSLFMRGASNAHTLVMVDGTAINDPMSPNNAYDFAHFSLENIERVEVVRGPQSTLYGSDAMAGVVNIITRRGEGALSGHLSVEAGSYGLQRERVHFSGGRGNLGYSLSGAHLKTDGFSAALDGEEDDGYRNTSLAMQLNYDVSERLGFDLVGRHTDASADIDAGSGAFNDDPNYVSDSVETTVKLGMHWRMGAWDGRLNVSNMALDRDLLNDADLLHPDDTVDAYYRADRTMLDWQNRFEVGRHSLVAGLEHEDEQGRSVYDSQSVWGPYFDEFIERDTQITSLYVQDHIPLGRGALTLGGRHDDHDRFGGHTTWRAAGSFALGESTWLKGSLGTGFKAPSLFQLFSSLGNEALQPEESEGWDLGLRHARDGYTIQIAWFRSEMENLIDYDFATNSYININQATTRGLEFDVDWRSESGFGIAASYTYTDAADEAGMQLVRRPRRKAYVRVSHLFNRGDVGFNVRHTGVRNFNDFINYTGIVEEPAHTLLGASGSLRLGRMFRLNISLENLLDKDYQEVFGYTTPGASGFVGLRYLY